MESADSELYLHILLLEVKKQKKLRKLINIYIKYSVTVKNYPQNNPQ